VLKRWLISIGLILVVGLSVWWVADGFQNDYVDYSWRPSAYNLEVTKCIEEFTPIARVYDFDKMSDRTNEQLAEITGVSETIIAKCRR